MNDQLASIQLEQSNGSLLVRLSGEIDLSNSDRLQQNSKAPSRAGLAW